MSTASRLCTALALACALLVPRPAWSDAKSGPIRRTLTTRDWGTAYVLEAKAQGLREETDAMNHKTFYGREGMYALDLGKSSLGFSFPLGEPLSVDEEGGSLVVRAGSRSATVSSGSDSIHLELPSDDVTFSKVGSTVHIQGRKGKVVVEQRSNGFVIMSPAGETRYLRSDFDKPYVLEGTPMLAHPYLRRGVHFESQGFGFFIDLHLERWGRAFTLLPWEPLEIETFTRP